MQRQGRILSDSLTHSGRHQGWGLGGGEGGLRGGLLGGGRGVWGGGSLGVVGVKEVGGDARWGVFQRLCPLRFKNSLGGQF